MYKGDVTPEQAFAELEDNDNAVLIDVRTQAEWDHVGIPEVDGLLKISWQISPTMERNHGFVDQVRAKAPETATVLLLCRSGARSAAAAAALTAAGFENAYNVAGGFEGDPDEEGQRGTVNGWKYDGLPWTRQ